MQTLFEEMQHSESISHPESKREDVRKAATEMFSRDPEFSKELESYFEDPNFPLNWSPSKTPNLASSAKMWSFLLDYLPSFLEKETEKTKAVLERMEEDIESWLLKPRSLFSFLSGGEILYSSYHARNAFLLGWCALESSAHELSATKKEAQLREAYSLFVQASLRENNPRYQLGLTRAAILLSRLHNAPPNLLQDNASLHNHIERTNAYSRLANAFIYVELAQKEKEALLREKYFVEALNMCVNFPSHFSEFLRSSFISRMGTFIHGRKTAVRYWTTAVQCLCEYNFQIVMNIWNSSGLPFGEWWRELKQNAAGSYVLLCNGQVVEKDMMEWTKEVVKSHYNPLFIETQLPIKDLKEATVPPDFEDYPEEHNPPSESKEEDWPKEVPLL